MPQATTFILFYLALLSLIAVIVTIADKLKAIHHGWRVPEATLLWISALGGSAAMLITMLLIRHKTRHVKFMAGIPLIMLLQAGAALAVMHFLPQFIRAI